VPEMTIASTWVMCVSIGTGVFLVNQSRAGIPCYLLSPLPPLTFSSSFDIFISSTLLIHDFSIYSLFPQFFSLKYMSLSGRIFVSFGPFTKKKKY
jgi:hypothetical protein